MRPRFSRLTRPGIRSPRALVVVVAARALVAKVAAAVVLVAPVALVHNPVSSASLPGGVNSACFDTRRAQAGGCCVFALLKGREGGGIKKARNLQLASPYRGIMVPSPLIFPSMNKSKIVASLLTACTLAAIPVVLAQDAPPPPPPPPPPAPAAANAGGGANGSAGSGSGRRGGRGGTAGGRNGSGAPGAFAGGGAPVDAPTAEELAVVNKALKDVLSKDADAAKVLAAHPTWNPIAPAFGGGFNGGRGAAAAGSGRGGRNGGGGRAGAGAPAGSGA